MQPKTLQARSVTEPLSAQKLALKAEQAFNARPLLIQRVLQNRNIYQTEHPLKDLLPPSGLKDIDLAANRVVEAIEQKQSILIVGDYDVDGATSTALAISSLQDMGVEQVNFTVPNRFRDGYGLSLKLAEKIGKTPPDLLITVDNGIASVEGVAFLKALGVDVIVTDHHLAGDVLPEAYAIVNPNQPACGFKSKALAGVGVMFYLLMAVNRVLREKGYYEQQGLSPDILAGLDLVALGTVADVVSLDRNNRILVAQGVARMRAGRTRLGIAKIMQIAKKELSNLVAQDLGFVVGPRLNAAGRLDDISSGIACLLAQDETSAQNLAEELDAINHQRKHIEKTMLSQALLAVDKLKADQLSGNAGIVLYDESWHEGVIGLIASRIKDKTTLPVLVFATAEDKKHLKGSARSISGVHIRDVLANIDAKFPNMIQRFGGHAMAAGLSIERENLSAFEAAFQAETRLWLAQNPPSNLLLTDGKLEEGDFNLAMAGELNTLLPWGQACPEPVFEGEFEVLNVRFVGEIHLKLVLRLIGGSMPIDAICFRYLESGGESGNESGKRAGLELQKIKAAYRLDINEFRGKKTLQLILKQIEPLKT